MIKINQFGVQYTWSKCACDCVLKGNVLEKSIEECESKWKLIAENFVCICLQDRDDRWVEASAVFHSFGLCRLVDFYRPQKITNLPSSIKSAGAYGCWTSHQYVASCFPKNKSLVVFEDDVDFLPHQKKSIKNLDNTLNALKSLEHKGDILFLGHLPLPFFSRPVFQCKNLLHCKSFLLHAYRLNQKGIHLLGNADYEQWAIKQKEEGGIDEWVCWNMDQYAVFPQFAVQRKSKSSNFLKRGSSIRQLLSDHLIPLVLDFHRQFTFGFEVALIYLPVFLFVLLLALLLLVAVFRLRK